MTNESVNLSQGPIKQKNSNKAPWVVLTVVIAIAVIGLAVAYFAGFFDKAVVTPETITNEQPTDAKVIAKVDGIPIAENEVAQRTQIIVSGLQKSGTQITDEQLTQARQFAFQQLVNETLILQAAKQNNISVSSEEVQTEFDKVVANYPDEQSFQKDLSASNVTEEAVKADIARQLTIQKYINGNTDSASIEVTEAEINELYNKVSEQQENVPKLEEARQQLEQQIFQDKLNQQVDKLIKALRDAANIEILN